MSAHEWVLAVGTFLALWILADTGIWLLICRPAPEVANRAAAWLVVAACVVMAAAVGLSTVLP